MYKMLLGVLIREGIYAHTHRAKHTIIGVCIKCSLTTPVEKVMTV